VNMNKQREKQRLSENWKQKKHEEKKRNSFHHSLLCHCVWICCYYCDQNAQQFYMLYLTIMIKMFTRADAKCMSSWLSMNGTCS
jgi:hypothetical protein